jgi:hypothetical protein
MVRRIVCGFPLNAKKEMAEKLTIKLTGRVEQTRQNLNVANPASRPI